MKRLVTLMICAVSLGAEAQNDPYWNPDANGDDLIGVADLASFLSVYNTNIGVDSSVTCDFNGSTWEQLVLDVLNEVAIIDSVYFEYTLSGVIEEYTFGCPDPTNTYWTLSDSGVATSVETYFQEENDGQPYDYRYLNCGVFTDSLTYGLQLVADEGGQGGYNISGQLYITYDSPPYAVFYGLDIIDGPNVPVQPEYLAFDTLGLHLIDFDPEFFIRAVPYWSYTE